MKIEVAKKEIVDRTEKSVAKKQKITLDDIYEQNSVIIELLKSKL